MLTINIICHIHIATATSHHKNFHVGFVGVFQIQHFNMKTTSMIILAVVLFVSVTVTVVAKFTNRPLNGNFCNDTCYMNLTNTFQHQRLHRCLSNSQCATLSYNPVGRYCLLRSEPCPSATLHPQFMMMVFRETERHHDCISWIPKTGTTTDYRLFTSTAGYQYNLGRSLEEDNQITGFAYGMHLRIPDRESNRENLVDEYELLAVSPSCTLAWVPYNAGDTFPDGVLQTGLRNGVAVYSIMVPRVYRGNPYQRFGFYVAGEDVGYYTWHSNIHRPSEMYILVKV